MTRVAPQLGPLAALVARYDRLAARGDAPLPGFAPALVSFVIVITPAGQVVAVQDERSVEGRKSRPRSIIAPQPPKRTSGINSGFLWDKTSYVLGVTAPDPALDAQKAARAAARTAEEHSAFKERHRSLLGTIDDVGAVALLAFLASWGPGSWDALDTPYRDEMLDENVAFRLDGDAGYLHDRPALKELAASLAGESRGPEGQCLVTGRRAPIARLHQSIKGVPGAQSSGASLVSFNEGAFTSYGKEQGANAPTSELAAFAYTTALNDLISASDGVDANGRPRYRNRVQIGDATAVFWVDPAVNEAVEAETLVSLLFGGQTTASEAETGSGQDATVRYVMTQLAQGRPLRDVATSLEGLQVHVLGLSPNAARLSVRFWHSGSLGELADHFQAHWMDLRLSTVGQSPPPPLWRLLRSIAAQGEAKNIPPNQAGELTRAILTGGRYPVSLLTQALMRIRADQGKDKLSEPRIALIKAIIVRNQRKDGQPTKEDYLVSLDPDESNAGYRLGRLFAVLEAAQSQAIPGINASIRDRFYGSASATPAHVFPILLRGVQDHLSKVRKTKAGLAIKYEKAIAEIVGGLGASLPPTLNMKDQGLFAIGYYHQRSAIYARREDGEMELEDTLAATNNEDEDQ